MADRSKIEWTDATWNPITGCSIVSPGCKKCYAMRHAARMERMLPPNSHYAGLTNPSKAGPVWTGKVNLAPDHIMTKPLRWRKPKRIFVNSMSDLFHESIPDEWIDKVFAVMAMAPQHIFQVLTKRPERMRDYFAARQEGDPWAEAADEIADIVGNSDHPAVLEPKDIPLRNVWKGVSVEDQPRADERIPLLLDTPAAVRWISAEPLLALLDIDVHLRLSPSAAFLAGMITGDMPSWTRIGSTRLDWVVAGGESGPGARPCDIEWIRSLRDQCAGAGVPFFWKQHVEAGRKISLPMLDGVMHDAFPDVAR